MLFNRSSQRIDKVDTVIGPGTVFEGSIKATGIVRIDGKLSGHVETSGDIIVGEKGEVRADMYANNFTIAGSAFGDIHAKEKTVILHKGRVEGDIDTKNIVIEEGAVFKGRCIMGDTKAASGNQTIVSQNITNQSSANQQQTKKEQGKTKAS